MINYVLGQDLGVLQPVFFLGEDMYVLSRRETNPPAFLITALGVEHPLRRFCCGRNLMEHQSLLNRQPLHRMLKDELKKAVLPRPKDPVDYFLEQLVPAFLERDWNEEPPLPAGPKIDCHCNDLLAEVHEVVGYLPAPLPPAPSLWALGRIWLLAEGTPVNGSMHVRLGKVTLKLTGNYVPVRILRDQWVESVTQAIIDIVARIANQPESSMEAYDELKQAKEKSILSERGFLQFEDLLLIQGKPPLLGHIIPAHYNYALGRHVDRDLSVTAPLTIPPKIADLTVAQRDASGRWMPLALPNGLCLGSKPSGAPLQDPGLALAAFLRWAAIRIAANGKFHEND